jgi:hypothetical protein
MERAFLSTPLRKRQHIQHDHRPSNLACERIQVMQNMVAFCSAKVAITDATFAERKATIIDSHPLSEKSSFFIHPQPCKISVRTVV